MKKNSHIESETVFEYFKELCSIPHGSGNMDRISEFCMNFAQSHGLWAYRDEANNVVIKKDASKGYENSEPVILQGHLDMVCQKDAMSDMDFENDGIDIYEDDGYIRARGTTLGADNGIAVAMIMAILADENLSHPPIEAVFTTDEEIGMVGALALDMSVLSGKKMINIDSENPEVVTVSCAGGSDFTAQIPVKRCSVKGKCITITLKGLIGGHSGVEINSGRVNANILMGRFMHYLRGVCRFDIIDIDGGDKANAIPPCCKVRLISRDANELVYMFEKYAHAVREEIKSREPEFVWETEISDTGDFDVFDDDTSQKLINTLVLAPNGVMEMSAEIEALVETSLNMGILKTEDDFITVCFALRSNKMSAISYLEERLKVFFDVLECPYFTGGHYPAWEYKDDSVLRELYIKKSKDMTGKTPRVEAIHAGLECGVFASGISGLDCISIGPEMHGIHTVQEKVSIKSTKEIFEIICRMLESLQ